MKVYNEIVFNVDGDVIYEDSYEYSGDVMLCQDDVPDMNSDGVINVLDLVAYARWKKEQGTSEEDIEDALNKASLGALAGDIKEPNPSLPSISNVGATSFTGAVSNIPGGFQPLPQISGAKKKLYQLSKFHGGINQKSSPRDIADFECQEASNITFSKIGRIKVLGDCLNTDAIGADVVIDGTMDENLPGYGLFQFIAPADHDAGNIGETVFTCVANGNAVDVYTLPDEKTVNWITGITVTDSTAVSQIYYAAGNGLYVANTNFAHSGNNRCKIYVDREDAGSNTVRDWVMGNPLIDSPTYDSDSDAAMVAGTVKCTHDGGTATPHVSSTLGHGSVIADCAPSGSGSWDGTYYFYISWLFDGGAETGLTSFADDGGDNAASNGIAFDEEKLSFNLSINHSNTNPLGGDKRIEGARIYFKEAGTSERWLLAEFNMIDGVRGALDSSFTPWNEASDIYNLPPSDIIFDSPPAVYSYSSLNGYYANEVYAESSDSIASETAGPTPHNIRYKTAVVGQQGVVFIGNVRFQEKHMPDGMMFSMLGKPGVFPRLNLFDSPSSDGSPITALASFQDTILQFKENAMYVINVSNPAQFYAEASFRDCGVFNPCQVFTASFGVIFVNKNGCYIYDGKKVTSLTHGKFDWVSQSGIAEATSNETSATVPSIGYDPRSQSIIVLKNIANTSGSHNGWVYSMITQSWTEADDIISNADNRRHTNFIITNDGYLAVKRDNDGTLLNYNQGQSTSDTQDITYQTKDIDFGFPSQTKKIFKVYITYTSGSNVPASDEMLFGVDGATPAVEFSSGTFQTSQTNGVTTFVPTSAATGCKSFAIKINGATVDESFEINDISILYRLRPVK